MSARFTITLSDKTFARVQNYCRQERRTDRVDACRLLIEDALDEWEHSHSLVFDNERQPWPPPGYLEATE